MRTGYRYTVPLLIAVIMTSCGVNQQVDQLKALSKCKYQLASTDSVYLANTDVSRLVSAGGFNLSAAPGLAFAFLQKDVPLKAILNIQIKNPGKDKAGINEFEYKVFIKDQELTSGNVNQTITVEPNGGVTIIPLKINQNIYPLLANPNNRRALVEFFSTDSLKSTSITLKIKPAIAIGNKKVFYPGYINIDKEINNKMLLSYLRQ